MLLGISLGAGIGWTACVTPSSGDPQEISAPANSSTNANHGDRYTSYGGSASCRECHRQEYDDWNNSHHALAERSPVPSMDNAAFIPQRSFTIGTQTITVLTNDGHFQFIAAGLDGTNQTFTVSRILADNPLRQMLIPISGGRLQATEDAWDPRSNQWFDVYGNEDRKPGEWGHWLGRGMNWNSMCAICHNTRLQKNYDAATDSYHTTMIETGVGCEACHGPMKEHNLWQEAHRGQSLKDPTIHKLTPEQMVETCAGCHSRIHMRRESWPTLNLRAGTLDDTSWVRPVAQMWISSAQPWALVSDDILSFEEQPADFGPILAAWAERAKERP